MKKDFLYKYGIYPHKSKIIKEVTLAASRLEQMLSVLDLDDINLSEYNIRYFGDYIKTEEKRILNLQKYSYILSWVLSGLDKPKEEIVFLDHGGGHGLMSLLAKEYGIGTVIHNDIYPVSCKDARSIALSLNLEADIYIPGEIDDVLDYLKKSDKFCDAVASYDVIEHIYDINDFLNKIHLLSPGPMSLFFASAANERNPRINRELQAMHRKFEYHDRTPKFGRKPTDATKAIIELRRKIISKHTPSLSSADVDKLAILTRGLVVGGIQDKVNEYCKTSIFPPGPTHPTNTCDPYTGNWFEHLMNPEDLASVLDSTGFSTTIKCGFYSQPKNLPKRLVKLALNFLIKAMGIKGLLFAPYYAISAKK